MKKSEFLDKIRSMPDEAELIVIQAASAQTFALKAASEPSSHWLKLEGDAIYLASKNTIFLRGW